LESQEVARHIDTDLLKKLEIRRFGDGKKKQPRGKKVPAGQSYTAEVEESSEEEQQDDPVSEEEDEEDEENIEQQELDEEELPDLTLRSRKAGTYVVAMYEGQWFLAEVCEDQKNVQKGYVHLSYMVIKGTNCFAWGAKSDVVLTLEEDIVLDGVIPEPLNSRGYLGLTKTDLKIVQTLTVVVYLSFLGLLFFLYF
jgi:hypothetical protein